MYPVFNETLLHCKPAGETIKAEEWLPAFMYPSQKAVKSLLRVKTVGKALKKNRSLQYVKACYAFPSRYSKDRLLLPNSKKCLVLECSDWKGNPLPLETLADWSQVPVDAYDAPFDGSTFEGAMRSLHASKRYFVLYALADPLYPFRHADFVEREEWFGFDVPKPPMYKTRRRAYN